MAASADDSLYPIAVLIDELKNEEIQVRRGFSLVAHFVFTLSVCVFFNLINYNTSLTVV